MCGIAGMVDWRAAMPAGELRAIGEAMTETLRHRGPGGAQPMHSADRRYAITFNGEIYNYRDIRRELEAAGRVLRSDSDTEVLLEACALWGVEGAIDRAIGMFAF